MQILVHGGVHFARVFFTCTHALSHGCLWSHMLLHRDIFARRHRGTEGMLFYTNTFTERWFHTEQFYTETKTSRGAFTKECMCTKVFSYSIFTQTYYIIILNYFLWRTRVWRKEFSTHMQNHSFTTAFDGRDAFPGKGLAQDKPTLQFYLNVWRSTFCANGSRFVDINPPCPAARREKLETIKGVGVCKKLISTCVFTPATSHLHISTSHFQTTISACIYISSALHLHMAYIRLVAVRKKILSNRVFEFESAPERLSVRFMFASAPVYINFIL